MKLLYSFVLVFGAIFNFGCQNQSVTSAAILDSTAVLQGNKLIKEYQFGATRASYVIKVVYFQGCDKEPLANWKERLTRTLEDVSAFYKEEFSKHGIEIEGIPFEKRDGEFVFYIVKGDSIAKNYGIESGERIQKAITDKTNGKIDFSQDHVLVINGLCYQRNDGAYVFHSPYFGSGSCANGICQVADCELLDSKLLKDTVRRMAFSEMAINYKECSVAEFNSWYIGGIAHEMGHLFGLPHDYGNPMELNKTSISLMGEYGSRHFREYLWSGEKSSFFSSASILQLISHPIFTQVKKNKSADFEFNLSEIKLSKSEKGLILNTKIEADLIPYAVVALIRPSSVSEYFNLSFSNVIFSTDSINIELMRFPQGIYNLQLLFLFPEGFVKWVNKDVQINADGNANIFDVVTNGKVDVQKLYDKLKSSRLSPVIKTKLEILDGILNKPEPSDPSKYIGSKMVLSDAKWENASVGWENVARNYFTCEYESRFFLELQGKLYSKGLYAHSPSLYVFNLDKKWKVFSAIVGLRDYAHSQGSAKFTLIGDGKVLYVSPALRVNQKEIISADVSNVKILELRTDGTEGHCHNSWAIWVDPLLER